MLWNRIRGLWNAYHAILAVVLTILYWLFLTAISPMIKGGSVANYQPFVLYNLAAVVGLIIAGLQGRSSAATLLVGGFVNNHTLALKQTVYIGVALLITLALGREPAFGHTRVTLLFAFLGSVYVVFLICHFFIPERLADQLFSDEHEQRTLLIGPVEKAREVSKWMLETAAFGFGMRGSAIEGDDEGRILHVTRVSNETMLQRIIWHERIRQILLLELPFDQEGLGLIADTARKAGVRLLTLENLEDICRQEVSFFSIHGKNFVSLMNEPLESPINRIIKRTIDIFISLPVIVLLLPPLCIFVKICQAIQSPGPLFFRETRSGLANLPFRIFNFRTARVDSPANTSKSSDQGRYPLGLLLQKTRLDRFPEFLNVFLGHMSVAGPRPRRPIHNRRFSEIAQGYHCRAFVKPGITGLAQVSGYCGEFKNDADVTECTKLDVKYVENWSLPLDFWIILNTIFQILRPPKTAY